MLPCLDCPSSNIVGRDAVGVVAPFPELPPCLTVAGEIRQHIFGLLSACCRIQLSRGKEEDGHVSLDDTTSEKEIVP